MEISKLTLGTAQLGLDYGIANLNGKPGLDKALEILNYAWNNGINTFDTSPTYGDSEQKLGSFISENQQKEVESPIIVSKLPKLGTNIELTYENVYNLIERQINQSKESLKLELIPIYLIHHAPDIFLNDGLIIKCLNQLKEKNQIGKIGISVYTPDEVETSLKFKEIEVIQVPINIFDQRLINLGLLKQLKSRNITIFARSIFLQGLFLMSPEKLPANLENAKEPLLKLRGISKEFNIDLADLAVLFIRDISEIDSIVIGVDNLDQLANNIQIVNEKSLSPEIFLKITREFSDISENIINPSLWNK